MNWLLKALFLSLLTINTQAQAATYSFTGVAFNQLGIFAGQGAAVHGTISFPDAMVNNGSFAFEGFTNHFSIAGANAFAVFSFSLTNGSETHSWSSTNAANGAFNEIQITDNTSRDAWSFDSSAGAPQTTTAVSIDLTDKGSKTFVAPGSKNLTGVEIDPLANFAAVTEQSNVIWVRDNSTTVLGSLGFTITSITNVAPVPLPGAAWLFLSALGVLGLASRR